MDEDLIYDEFVEETKKYKFPAYRYWKDGELIGDNLDIFLDVEYGDPEVLGVVPEDDFWVANILKEGVEQEKKFFVVEYEVGPDGVLPFSEYPEVEPEETEGPMDPDDSQMYPDTPTDGEVVQEDDSVIPPVDDSEDTQTEVGDDGSEVDLGGDLESDGSIEDLPDETLPPE